MQEEKKERGKHMADCKLTLDMATTAQDGRGLSQKQWKKKSRDSRGIKADMLEPRN